MTEGNRKRALSTCSGKPEDDNLDADVNSKQVSGIDKFRLSEMGHSEVYYMPSFISKEIADGWFTALMALDSWYQPKLKMYGREITQSRKIAAYSNDPKLTLRYSGQTVDMKYKYPAVLQEIQDHVEERLGVKFNHVMLNLYENGSVYIGKHRDNLENRVIASVSVGAPRTFIMTRDKRPKMGQTSHTADPSSSLTSSSSAPNAQKRRKISDAPTVEHKSWVLQPGSLVVMQGETQKYWKHEIPKEPKVKEPRISLTFRQLIP